MKLILCPTCKEQVSSLAALCPHCGNPIMQDGASSMKYTRQRSKTGLLSKLVGLIILAVVAAAVYYYLKG